MYFNNFDGKAATACGPNVTAPRVGNSQSNNLSRLACIVLTSCGDESVPRYPEIEIPVYNNGILLPPKQRFSFERFSFLTLSRHSARACERRVSVPISSRLSFIFDQPPNPRQGGDVWR